MNLVDRMNSTAFLGKEFLTHLWHRSELQEGLLDPHDGRGAIELWLTSRIVLSAAGQGADKVSVKTDEPSASEEARQALREGKKVDTLTCRIVRDQREWTVTIKGETLAFSGVRTPALLTRDEDDRVREQYVLLDQLDGIVRSLYRAFLAIRTDRAAWAAELDEMRAWVRGDDHGEARAAGYVAGGQLAKDMLDRHGAEGTAKRLDVAAGLIDTFGVDGAARVVQDVKGGMTAAEAGDAEVRRRLAGIGETSAADTLREAAEDLRAEEARDDATREARGLALDAIADALGRPSEADATSRRALVWADLVGLRAGREELIARVMAGHDAKTELQKALGVVPGGKSVGRARGRPDPALAKAAQKFTRGMARVAGKGGSVTLTVKGRPPVVIHGEGPRR